MTDRLRGCTGSEERDLVPNDHVGSHRRKTEREKAECDNNASLDRKPLTSHINRHVHVAGRKKSIFQLCRAPARSR